MTSSSDDAVVPETALSTTIRLSKEAASAVELISVTDFYALKTIKDDIITDAEYYDLIKLRIDYFEQLANIFENLK
jgi:hypothetical protein